VNACKDIPDTSGYEAAEGTVFHHFAAFCVEFGFDPEVFIGRKQTVPYTEYTEDGDRIDGDYVIEFNGEMADSMRKGLEFINDWQDEDTILFVEERVDLSPWLGADQFGTSDVGVVDPVARRILVFDWKYGRGVPVSPDWNDQLILYCLGVWNSYARKLFDDDPTDITIEIVIDQPRAPGGGGVWKTTMRRILKEGEEIIKDAEATDDPNAEFQAGEKQCRFCPLAKSEDGCRALDEFVEEMCGLDFDSLLEDDFDAIAADPEKMNPTNRALVLLNRKLIERWMDGLHDQVMRDHKRGLPTPLQKVVVGRKPARKVRANQMDRYEKILKKTLGEKAYQSKILTPTAAEEALGKRVFEPLLSRFLEKREGKPSLVPETDSRDAIPDVTDGFDEIDEGFDDNETALI